MYGQGHVPEKVAAFTSSLVHHGIPTRDSVMCPMFYPFDLELTTADNGVMERSMRLIGPQMLDVLGNDEKKNTETEQICQIPRHSTAREGNRQ
ncbi:hypothetical protein N7445_001726 [Penicillium cf. griseofulvum]|nr:hypothetical protein N7445_001726 [Penicillium cf. griseofulvum]